MSISAQAASRSVLFALSLLLFCSCVSALATADSESGCTPSFPLKEGWQGGDAAYSIPLADGRNVWIFGDTLYGKERVVHGTEPRMVHNSIGISTCRNGEFHIEYAIKQDAAGAPRDFFETANKKTWYWPLAGFRHRNELWVTLLCLRATPASDSPEAALGFETCGVDMARVSGLNRDPQQWKVEVLPFVADGVKAYPSAAAAVDGKYAYIFTLYENGTRPAILTRIPLAGLRSPAKNLSYLAKDGTWQPGLAPEKALPVMERGNSEMSVSYHAGRKEWIAVLNEPVMFSDRIILRTAKTLSGPWSEGKTIYTIPDMQKSAVAYDTDTFCYAAKEHPQFRNSDNILFTYVCNTLKPIKLVTNPYIYFPKVVRVPLPAAGF
ncbi:MAG TPA: DUF4185 domain-containing protein [Terriglobales bacterium]|nr:DUF4185 domain-containing protein [Terriglobales bacterium]